MRKFFAAGLLLVLFSLSVGASAIKEPKGFEGRLLKSTLALYGTKGDVTHFLCTAEPFEKTNGGYHLISAGHCVQLVPEGVVFSVADEIEGPRYPVIMMKAYMGDGLDFSEFDFQTARKYPVMNLGDEREASIGDRVVNPNFSAGLGKQLGFGTISSSSLIASPYCPQDLCIGDFLAQIDGTGGASGSAVVSLKTHRVIGIVSIGFGEPIGLGVKPISLFSKFLAGPSQPHPVADADEDDK